MPKHARLSPSSAHRWGSCPASVVLDDRVRIRNDGELPDEAGNAAKIGTICHAIAELEIKMKFWPDPEVFEDEMTNLIHELKELTK